MTRPIWKGFISFGLVAIPVNIITVEERSEDIKFHLLDSRDESRIRYKKINADTGKEVPWDKIVRAYEFEKDRYVVIKDEDLKKNSPEEFKSIEINEFVDLKEIDSIYYDKPYYILPEGKNQKAYVLLREALKKTNTVGVGKIVIHMKEHLSLIVPHDHAMVLNFIRFNQEIKDESELKLPGEDLKKYKINDREIKMAINLIEEMTTKWDPAKYHNESHEALKKWIDSKTTAMSTPAKEKKGRVKHKDEVVDFISLLKSSLKKRAARKRP